MKTTKFLISLFVSLIVVSIRAQGIDFNKEKSWQTIKKKAKVENKLIFVDVYTTWCGPCKRMDKQVFSDENVGTFYNTNFISYKIDAEKGEGIHFAKAYHVTSYPSLLFIDGNGKQISKEIEALSIEDFLEFGKASLSSENQFATLSSLYNNGSRDPEVVLQYLALLKGKGLPTEEIALAYYATIDQDNWISPKNLELIGTYLHSPYNRVVEYLAKNKEPEETISTLNKVYSTIFYLYKNYINTVLKNEGNKESDALILSYINSHFYSNEASLLTFRAKRVIFARNKDWDGYAKVVIEYVNKYYLDTPNPTGLNNCAWLFYKNVTDKNALNLALGWINTVLEVTTKEDSYYYQYLDTQASLLYKLGKKKEALEAANTVIKAAKETGEDHTAMLTLVKKIKN